MSLRAVPRTPWYAHLRGAWRRAARQASHGSWLARHRSSMARWVRGPGYAPAWDEALRRLPSLARLDNAGEFGRTVLRRMFDRACFMIRAENPRTRQWLRRMRAAGIVETRRGCWGVVEEIRLLIPEED